MFLEKIFYNNPVKLWLIAVSIFFVGYVVLISARKIVYKKIQRFASTTKTDIDDLVAELIKKIHALVILIIALYTGMRVLEVSDKITRISDIIFIIAMLFQAALWGSGIISFFINRYRKHKIDEDAAGVTTFTALGFILKLILWTVLVLVALDNMGVNITALVAGLGVGGVAVALAVQNILSDLFASLSIVLDKPFVMGDFIIIDNYLGTIEHIGLKTTRIRSLSGEQLIFSNSDLLSSRIRNYKRMQERRVVFGVGVIYQTPKDKLEIIPGMIKEIIESKEQTRFDRAHFKEFGNFSLNFEIVYWIHSPDYNIYMDIQQAINLEIFQKFQENKIEFAYPTQKLFLTPEDWPQAAKTI
ncbi:MAG: mechanosensitive ion channel family protein [Calditrichaeota bacterium]|nr:mechanosensitive ion channel family protein [Calditrichota bacterium]